MNEIVILETAKGYSLEADLKLLEDTLKLEIENARAVKPTPENSDLCAKEVTKLNKTLKDWKAKLASAEEPYVSNLENAVKPIVDLLNDFSSQAKDYQTEVLNAKKEADLLQSLRLASAGRLAGRRSPQVRGSLPSVLLQPHQRGFGGRA